MLVTLVHRISITQWHQMTVTDQRLSVILIQASFILIQILGDIYSQANADSGGNQWMINRLVFGLSIGAIYPSVIPLGQLLLGVGPVVVSFPLVPTKVQVILPTRNLGQRADQKGPYRPASRPRHDWLQKTTCVEASRGYIYGTGPPW